MDYEGYEWSMPDLDPTVLAWLEGMRERSRVTWPWARIVEATNAGDPPRGDGPVYQVLDETHRMRRHFLNAPRQAGKSWLDEGLWHNARVDGDALDDAGERGDAERDRIRETLTLVTVYDCELGCIAEATTPDGRRFYGFDAASPAG